MFLFWLLGDMWPNQNGEEEPEWVKTEREQFHSYRDKNNDGKMDKEEVREWIIPPDYDHSEAEAKHLIYESDVDRVGCYGWVVSWELCVCVYMCACCLLVSFLYQHGCSNPFWFIDEIHHCYLNWWCHFIP